MPVRAVLFDLDGTLVDSLRDIGESMNEALAELGLGPHPLDAYRRFVGDGVGKLAERALPPQAAHRQGEAVAAFRRIYAERLLETTAPYAGIPAALAGLAARGLPLGVLTNKPQEAAERIVAALFPAGTFARVAGQREGSARKPDPAEALRLACELGFAPDELALVGDTSTDMQTATRGGLLPVGALWGFRDRDELMTHGARRLVARPDELEAALLR